MAESRRSLRLVEPGGAAADEQVWELHEEKAIRLLRESARQAGDREEVGDDEVHRFVDRALKHVDWLGSQSVAAEAVAERVSLVRSGRWRLSAWSRWTPFAVGMVVAGITAGAWWTMSRTAIETTPSLRETAPTGVKLPTPAQATPPVPQASEGETKGLDLLGGAERGEFSDNQGAKAIFFNFPRNNPVNARAGDAVRIEYSLTGSDVVGIHLRPKGEDPDHRGDMQTKRGVGGSHRVLEVEVPSDRDIWQITFQIGEDAWGPFGGSAQAELMIHSMRLLPKSSRSVAP